MAASISTYVTTRLGQSETTGELTLRNNGVLDLNGYTLTVANGATTGITTDAATAFVISENTSETSILKWNIHQNTGSYVFPFRNYTSVNLNFTFNATSAGIAAGTGSVALCTYPTAAADNLPYPSGVTHMNYKNGSANALYAIDRFWRITLANYTTNPTADITFTYDATNDIPGNSFTEANLMAQRWDAGATPPDWQQNPAGTINTTNKTVTVTGISSFSPWTLVDYTRPLPITLLSFDAKPSGDSVLLDWVTASEINNDYFTVERSSDGQTFEAIAQVKGAGNSTQTLNYSTIDYQPRTKNFEWRAGLYYRLKQTDYDGKFSYSDIRAVHFSPDNAVFKVFPNPLPTGSTLNFEFQTSNQELQILNSKEILVVLTDANGKEVYSKVFVSSDSNGNLIAINPENQLSPGIFFITASSVNTLFRQKLIVK